MATLGINNETEAGNLKAQLRKKILKWILDSSAAVSSDITKELFIHCALSLLTDGSPGNLIHCLKKKQPCFQGREVLSSQLMVLQNEENPFVNSSECDIEESYESCQLLDQDEEGDKVFKIL